MHTESGDDDKPKTQHTAANSNESFETVVSSVTMRTTSAV